ncbi:acyl--CoA ligase [Ferrovibrio terrae]|uniref:Acyl--CoA ligase n=1 Tax=Ferrovibrio terrae TaxID=2594003 RepID=A0A516GY79_9PROT|nr:class I adenylate-forming enzyme family protein [Ferrovibrio terrae]QDO96447.1 acyl--CoA ligase [Ferrovibrio terrae]
MKPADALLAGNYATLPDLVRAYAEERPDHPAVIDGDGMLTYGQLDARADRVAAALQRDNATKAVSIVSTSRNDYVTVYLGALRAGLAVAPLAPSSLPEQIVAMAQDADAQHLFLDADNEQALRAVLSDLPPRRIRLDTPQFEQWLAPEGSKPAPAELKPEMPFNIIYSSGTTGTPKGIVQSHGMRWLHMQRANLYGYDRDAVTLLSTPLYSNTTLVSLFPTMAGGGTAVLMAKFDVAKYLELAQAHHVTHTMLVPVQYSRVMAHADFDKYDLSNFRAKFCTSAPFSGVLKADILKRWPGKLIEYYGMTEGGGTCILVADEFPTKLHTVGRPAEGHDIRLITEDGKPAAPGEIGEIVGHSGAIMTHYHKQPGKTAEAEWFDETGKRFIRTGDMGRFDADGFMQLMDRRKDMVISGGFNIYPSDLEAVLRGHDAVADVAVVGVASEQWGETPVAFVVVRPGTAVTAPELLLWANAKLGKMQRISAIEFRDQLPRSAIGKVLKRELRDEYGKAATRP